MSARDFSIGLYREHLDEVSFLYTQRRAYVNDPEIKWTALRQWEERIEAHIDGLVLGDSLAIEICQRAAGEPGDLYAALSVFCRRKLKQDVFAMLGRLDPTDESACQACVDALCRDAPTEWQRDLIAALADARQFTSLYARVIGYRRFSGAEEVLGRMLSDFSSSGKADVAWALGRVGGPKSIPALVPLLDDPSEDVRESAALALMRLGDTTPLRLAMDAAADQPWARRVIGLSGNLQSAEVLVESLDRNGSDPDTVLALGLLGHLAAVSRLLVALEGDAAEAAATALNTITGASLYANVFVPDSVDVDELEPHEDERTARKEHPRSPGGRPYGTWERRVLSDREGWQAWLNQNRHRFKRELRWRAGQPYGPRALLNCMRLETSPRAIRRACYEELVIRYRLDVPFEIDLPVRQQLRFLDRIEAWVSAQSTSFADSQWYLDGKPQP